MTNGGCDADLLRLADILAIDVRDRTSQELAALSAKVKSHSKRLLAQRVEQHEQFRMAAEIGFDLFQGFFFQQPEVIPGRTLTSHEASRLRIFSLLEKDAPSLQELLSSVQADVSISYRLLAYINSAYFGFREKITSIKQAILLLGWTKIRSWLRVIILTDLKPPRKSQELALMSVQRGSFLELAHSHAGCTGCKSDSMFLLGLFSLLDVMLDMDMQEVMRHIALEQSLKDALCGEPNPFLRWLELVKAFERADWSLLDSLLEEMALEPAQAAHAYYEAMSWANSFFGHA